MSDKLKPSGYLARISKEIKSLQSHSSEGITAWPRNEEDLQLIANDKDSQQQLMGVWIDALISPPAHTPYASGLFKVECCLPRTYPFSPPHCKFITPIYHPNIDTHGRICVDILKEGNEPGKWKVTYNLLTVLSVIRQLLAEPNPEDPLEAMIAAEYKRNKTLFEKKAKEQTLLHATNSTFNPTTTITNSPSSSSFSPSPSLSSFNLSSSHISSTSTGHTNVENNTTPTLTTTNSQLKPALPVTLSNHEPIPSSLRESEHSSSTIPSSLPSNVTKENVPMSINSPQTTKTIYPSSSFTNVSATTSMEAKKKTSFFSALGTGFGNRTFLGQATSGFASFGSQAKRFKKE